VGLAAGELVAVVGDGEAAKSTLLASCGTPDQLASSSVDLRARQRADRSPTDPLT
jgi:predicted ABC-type transport system involved in lysophospholipase L1 biosynthesis ATPase subunit